MTTTPARDLHQEITDRFIAALEGGTRPWERDWLACGLPRRATGEEYQGINTMILSLEAECRGFANPHWMTFNQAKELGGSVRKGAKSAPVIFYRTIVAKDAGQGDDATDDEGRRVGRILKGYRVFNVEEVEGLPADRFATPIAADLPAKQRDETAESALRATGAIINEGGGRAYYRPSTDSIQLPPFADFTTTGGFLATMAHELIHWTGAAHRLDRVKGDRFGDKAYAFEELVAEIGAAFVCARLGVAGDHFENHAAYVASWLKALRDDKRLIFKAAGQAQAAANMILQAA